jgi:hypothetical protein
LVFYCNCAGNTRFSRHNYLYIYIYIIYVYISCPFVPFVLKELGRDPRDEQAVAPAAAGGAKATSPSAATAATAGAHRDKVLRSGNGLAAL